MNQKTPEYHELTGTGDRKSRAKASEIREGIPHPPSWLSKSARGEFRRIVRHLQERGTVSPADGAYLAVYAIAYSRLIEAQKDLDAKGLRVTQTVLDSHGKAVEVTRDNPALKLVQQSEKTVLSFLRQAGLTPATRERVKPARPRDEEEDPMSSNNIARMIADVGRS